MVLKLELSDAIRKRIETAATHKNLISVEAFVRHAMETELLRVECNCAMESDDGNLAAVAKQVEGLEKGQRAIVALVDSSAAILAELLRGPRARR